MAEELGRRLFLKRSWLAGLLAGIGVPMPQEAANAGEVRSNSVSPGLAAIPLAAVDSGLRVFNVRDPQFGAKGDGRSDDTTAIQAALDAGGRSSLICFPPGTYLVSAALQFESAQQLMAIGGSQVLPGQSTLRFSGTGGSMLRPKTSSANTVNVLLCGLEFDGGSGADTVVDFTRTSYSEIRGVRLTGSKRDAVGLLLDAHVSGQAYFNVVTNLKADVPNGTDVSLANGANVNTFIGGKFGNAQTGVAFSNLSSGNTFIGCDFEANAVQHVLIPSGNARNVFYGVHMEDSPIGFNIDAAFTVISGPSIASSVRTPVRDASGLTIAQYTDAAAGGNLSVGHLHQSFVANSVSTNAFVDPMPTSGTANAGFNLFRNVSTTGTRRLTVYRGDGTGTAAWGLDASTGQQTLSPFGNILTTGAGSPEGVLSAMPGSIYLNKNGGAGNTLFVKESGTGPTGWVSK